MNESYDVIVVGFGTAGAHAAIAAANNHATVLVLEKNSYPGGTSTGGGVLGFYGQPPYGLAADIDAKTAKYAKWHSCSKIEARKAILESDALAAGCHITYEATVFSVIREGNVVKGVKWADSDGLHHALCNMLIDATGDARICALAGCPFTIGRDSDNRCNAFTNSMLYRDGPEVYVANFDAGRINQYDPRKFSEAIQTSLQKHLQENYDAKSDERHQLTAADICGIREGHHVVTEEFLTLEKFFDGAYDNRTDIIGFARSNLDMHTYDIALESTILQDWLIAASMWGTPLWFPITVGTLIPKGMKGLLVAGRHLGVSHDYGQAVRMNAHVSRIGEAAGTIASLARDGDAISVSMDSIHALMPELSNPMPENYSFTSLDDCAIKEGLSSDAPGFAIWSARCRKLHDQLRSWMLEASDGSNLKCHSAFALSLIDDVAAVPELIRMATARDSFTPTTSRKYNHQRGYVAVYLLGRLRAAEAIPMLFNIMEDNDIEGKYQYHSFAVAALVRIAGTHPETRQIISDKLHSIIDNPDWTLMVRLKGTNEYYRIDDVFREFINASLPC